MTEEGSDQPGKQGNKTESNNGMKREMLVRTYLPEKVNKMQETEEFVINRSKKIC